MPRSPRARNAIGCVLAGLLTAFFALWWISRPRREEYARYSFAPDVEVRLFIESDFDDPPTLLYEIRKRRRLVVPATYLGPAPDGEKPLEVRTASSPDGSIVAVWSEGEFTILHHRPSGESWPRLLDHETARQPPVRDKWRARFALIRRQHGEIPLPTDLD